MQQVRSPPWSYNKHVISRQRVNIAGIRNHQQAQFCSQHQAWQPATGLTGSASSSCTTTLLFRVQRMLWEVGTSAVNIPEGARQPYNQAGPNLWLYTTRLDDPKYSLHSTKHKPNVPSLKGSPTPLPVPFLETFLRLHTSTPGTGVQPAAPTPRARCCHRGRPSLFPGWCSRILLAQCSTQVRFIDPARNELCREQ